ncbi:MAG TPA: glycosyltransferase family 2 protein, partial [Ignavibacteria bacterium]|nr:glycosyltransferase family 2 protein [Ignavibacteria bacterium]
MESCVRSVLNQNYQGFELIVLNDNSADRTGEILNELKLQNSRIKIINGDQLPEDWVGKNFACHQLQKEAKGNYLLFIDADTVLQNNCIGRALKFSVSKKADLLSVMPFEITVTFWEKIIIPMLYFA